MKPCEGVCKIVITMELRGPENVVLDRKIVEVEVRNESSEMGRAGVRG